MTALILATMKVLAALCLIAIMVILVSFCAWRVVYYGFHCRKNPIQKTALVTAGVLWAISAAVLNVM